MNDSNKAVLGLALASLRFRAMASLATFIAVLVGCSLLIACGGLFESAIRLSAAPQRLQGAPIVVTGPEGFKLPDQESETVAYAERSGVDADLVAKVGAVAGVSRALPDVSFPAVIGNPADTVLSGHGWASAGLTPYTLRSGNAPRSAGDVVLDAKSADTAGVQPGHKVDIVVAGQPHSFTVTGVAQASQPINVPAYFFSTVDVQRFSSRTDAIGVLPGEGVDVDDLAAKLARELPAGLSILTGDDRGSAEFTGIASSFLPLILLSAIFGSMVMVVMALVVSATISLSVRQRQQELALLRASGATPQQVRQMVVAETMTVAALAVLGGIALGGPMGGWIFTLSADRGVVPAALEFQQGIIPFVAGTVLALLVAWVAATFAARAAARTHPIQALAEAAVPPANVGPTRRLLAKAFAVATAGLAVATMFLDPETASAVGGPAVLTGSIAVGLIGPELIGTIVTKMTAAVRRIGGEGSDLAVINTKSRAAQFAAVLTPITLAAAIALGNIYAQTTRDAAAMSGHLDQLTADAVVTSTSGGISPELVAQLRSTPGVANASAMVTSHGWIENPYDGHGSDPWPLLGIDNASVLAVPVTSGSMRDLAGNTVALPEEQAEDLGIKLGDQVTMRLGDGAQADVKVVALLDSPSYYGSLVLPTELLAPHTTAGLPTQILIRGDGDTDELLSAIQQRLRAWPGAGVGDQSVLEASFQAGLDVQAWINYLLAALAIAYAAIASVNTLAVAVLSRRRELAVQRLGGATRRQVTRMLLIENGIIASAGLALGTVIAACTVVPSAVAVGAIVPSGPIWVFLAVVLAAFMIVWPVTIVAARLAMKHKPVDVIGSPLG